METSQEAQTELDQLARPHGNAGNEVSNDTRRLLCRRDDLKKDVIPLKASAATVAVAFDHVQPSLKLSYVMGPRVSALAPPAPASTCRLLLSRPLPVRDLRYVIAVYLFIRMEEASRNKSVPVYPARVVYSVTTSTEP